MFAAGLGPPLVAGGGAPWVFAAGLGPPLVAGGGAPPVVASGSPLRRLLLQTWAPASAAPVAVAPGCTARAQAPLGTWDLPRPGLRPTSPPVAGSLNRWTAKEVPHLIYFLPPS